MDPSFRHRTVSNQGDRHSWLQPRSSTIEKPVGPSDHLAVQFRGEGAQAASSGALLRLKDTPGHEESRWTEETTS